MIFAGLIALFLSNLSLGAEPRFEIPEGAYKSRAHCVIEKSTRNSQGNGWTDWHNEKNSETFMFTFWNTEESLNTIEDRGHQIKFIQTTSLSEDGVEIKRLEKVEEWAYRDREWTMRPYLLDITIQRRKGSPNLRIERWDDGRVFKWEASTNAKGAVTKNLLNPEMLNSKERQFGLLRTVCRY